jgi:hypothetical protein
MRHVASRRVTSLVKSTKILDGGNTNAAHGTKETNCQTMNPGTAVNRTVCPVAVDDSGGVVGVYCFFLALDLSR